MFLSLRLPDFLPTLAGWGLDKRMTKTRPEASINYEQLSEGGNCSELLNKLTSKAPTSQTSTPPLVPLPLIKICLSDTYYLIQRVISITGQHAR